LRNKQEPILRQKPFCTHPDREETQMRQVAALFLMLSSALLGQTYTISTFAGGGPPDNIPGASLALDLKDDYYACLPLPNSVAVDAAGDVFIASGYAVFRLDHATGRVSRVAGDGTLGSSTDDGAATGAPLGITFAVAVDSTGNNVYIAVGGGVIRKVSNGLITTVAGNGNGGDNGPAIGAKLGFPMGLAVDATGDLYIADFFDSRIRKVSNGVITTVAGNGITGFSGDNGPATGAQLGYPTGVAVDAAGNLYIAESENGSNNHIRKVSNGVITTVAGNGTGGFSGDNGLATSAQLFFPNSVAVDAAGNLYIADSENNRIRKVTNGSGVITTVAGNGTAGFGGDNSPATSAPLAYPSGVAVAAAGNLYVADWGNNRIRMISNGVITTIAGNGRTGSGDNGPATSAQLSEPWGVAVDSAGGLYIVDESDETVRKVSNGVITTVAGNGNGGDNGPAIGAKLVLPLGIAVDAAGDLYIADFSDSRIRKVSNGVITTVAGTEGAGFSCQPSRNTSCGDNGPATSAQLGYPSGVAVDDAGNLYIAEPDDNRIRKVSNGVITTVGINDLNLPWGLAVAAAGNLYVADSGNHRILMVSNGVITTIAGDGTQGFSGDDGPAINAHLTYPTGVAVDAIGNVYIADSGNNRVRKVSNGVITTIAGNGTPDSSGDNGPATTAELADPVGVAVDAHGNVYVADLSNSRVRILIPSGGQLTILNPGLLAPGTEGTAYGPVQLSSAGGTGVTNWTATGLPSGVTLSAAGVLSGTPAFGSQGGYNPQLTVTDSVGATASVNLSLTINPAPVPAPFITSVSPNPVLNANQTLFLNGSAFQNGPGLTVRLNWAGGQADLTGTQVTFLSSTQLSIAFAFSVAPGNWTAQVINPDAQISNALAFSVLDPGSSTDTHFALPQFVFGGAWSTALYFSNTTNSAATVQVDFMDDSASPLTVPLVGIGPVTTRSVHLNPGATVVLEAPNGGNQTEGWADISLPAGVIGYGVFQQVVPGLADHEALASFAPESSQTADLTYDDNRLTTLVALLNPSNQQVVVTITAYGPDGVSAGSAQVPLAPHSKQATVLETLPGLSPMSGKQGRVEFSVANGAVSALAFRFGGAVFTSIPIAYR
jgi:sugar lactone lactonase YvrE